MNVRWKVILISIPIFLFIAIPVYAASSAFLPKAQKWIDSNCFKRSISNQTSVLCYLFEKSSEQDQKLSDLETRLDALENPTPTPTPTGPTIVFAQDRPASFTTDFVEIPNGYTSMTFHVTTTGTLYGWSPIANVNSFVNEQVRVLCNNNICPDVTIPIISGFYKFGTGTSSGNITAVATLNAEPDNSTQTLGYGVNLPFTSGPIQTNPNYRIEVTVGQTNPQNITGISLQRNENGVFVQKEHVNCDGGAVCPLTDLPLLGGEYRVVVEGSGPGALVAVLIRPQ